MTSLWQNRTFAALFTAQAISLAGSGVTTVALAIFVHQLAGPVAATTVLGQALMLRILAFLMFSQPAGILADRVNRKYLMIGSDLARFGLMLLFPFISSIWQVYAAVFIVNALTAFFTPAFESSLPEVVGPELYVKALGYSRVAVDIEAVGGPVIAAMLVGVMGVRWVFWFDAVTYLVSAVLVLTVRVPSTLTPQAPVSARTLLYELTYGSRVLLREPAIRQALVMNMAGATAGACAIVVTIAYVRDALQQSQTVFTLVMAGVGLGSSLAAIVLGRVTSRLESKTAEGHRLHGLRHRWASNAVVIGGVAASLSLMPVILRPPILIFGVLWILNGISQALIEIPSAALVAEHTAPEERGRAYAAHFALTHVCWLVTYPVMGHVAAAIGPERTFAVSGIVCLTITGLALLIGRGLRGDHTHEGVP